MSFDLESKSINQLIEEDLTPEQLEAIVSEPTKRQVMSKLNLEMYCKNGHVRTRWNTGRKKKGNKYYRDCLDCRKNSQKEYTARKRLEKDTIS